MSVLTVLLQVDDVRLMTERDTGRSKGYAYVEFVDADSLRTAVTLRDRV